MNHACLKIVCFIFLGLMFSFPSLSAQFLHRIDLSRGLPWTWGGATQLEILDSGIYVGCHTTKRFYPIDGEKTIANYYDFTGNDLGYKVFPNQPQALGGGLRFLPGFGFIRSNVFKHPFNDSLVMDFYDLQGNLQWSRSGMERAGLSIMGVTTDSIAIGSTASYYTANPGIVKLDLQQGNVMLFPFTSLVDSLNSFAPYLDMQFIGLLRGGILDSNDNLHFVFHKDDSLGYAMLHINVTMSRDFNLVSIDTSHITKRTLKWNDYYCFDNNHFYHVKEDFDTLNNVSNYSVKVFSQSKSFVHRFTFSQSNAPEPFLASPEFFYNRGHLAVASREIIATPLQYDSTRFNYGYYSRFRLLDTNGNTLYDKTMRLDTNRTSRFVTEHIKMDDSLNVYFIASYDDRFDWYLGKVTASGAIVNPLSYFSAPASQGDGFNLYPNPFQSSIQIETSKVGDYQLKLYSLDGQLVEKWQMENKQFFTFNTENILPGIYLYRLERKDTGKVLQSGKLIK